MTPGDKEISVCPGKVVIKASSSGWTVLPVGALLLALLVIVAYSSVFSAGFIWDDDAYIINNQHLRSIDGLYSIWFEPGATPQYYPLVFSLFWVQYHLWGLDPHGYHLVNVLFHGANAVLLWSCLKRLEVPGALLAACIFALHPVQVESVAWVTELKNVLSTFFYLLAFLMYWRGFDPSVAEAVRGKAVALWGAAFIFFLLALLSKTVSGSLPAAILLLVWWQRGRFAWREVVPLLPFFALALVLGRQTAKLEVTHVLASGPEWDFSFVERLLIAGRAVWFYAGKLFWPQPLIFNYPRWQIDGGAWWQYLFPVTVVLLLISLWLLRKRIGRGPLAAVLFFIGTLFPALGFFNVYPMRYSFVADHFQYAASIGLIVLIAAAVDSLFAGHYPRAGRIATGILLVSLGALTWQQCNVYHDRLTLFSDTIAKNPESWLSYSNRGRDYALAGRDDLALADLQQSLAINPADADALQCIGVYLVKQKEYGKALDYFDRSIILQPWRQDYYSNRSIANQKAGRLVQAVSDVGKVIELDPYSVPAYLRRASLYAGSKEFQLALGDINQALDLDPDNPEAYANRGLLFYWQGRVPEALNDFNRALVLRPDSAATLYNRGLVFAAAGRSANAAADLQQAKKLGYSVSDQEISRVLMDAHRLNRK